IELFKGGFPFTTFVKSGSSFLTTNSIFTDPSGVIWGVTSRLNFADLKVTVAGEPRAAGVTYGTSVPSSILAFTLFAVITRGLEIIFPIPSDSSAASSRLRIRVIDELNNENASVPPVVCDIGRLTPIFEF